MGLSIEVCRQPLDNSMCPRVVICRLSGPKNRSSGFCVGRLLKSEKGGGIGVLLLMFFVVSERNSGLTKVVSGCWVWAKRFTALFRINSVSRRVICGVLLAIC